MHEHDVLYNLLLIGPTCASDRNMMEAFIKFQLFKLHCTMLSHLKLCMS